MTSVPERAEHADDVPELRAGRKAWVTRLLLLVGAAVVTVVVFRLVGQIDWAAVWDSLGRLTWWQPVVLFAMLVLRQVLNAMPLAIYIPGVTLYRATVNDVAASLMAFVAPPPSDLALRMAMFSSWGVSGREGLRRARAQHGDLLHRPVLHATCRLRPGGGPRLVPRGSLAGAAEHRPRGGPPGHRRAGGAQRAAGPDRRHQGRPGRASGAIERRPRGLGTCLPELPGRRRGPLPQRLPAGSAVPGRR